MKIRFIGLFLLSALATCSSGLFAAQDKVDFNRDIRPILSDTCFTCHGPDENKRKAKMRLDLRDEAFKPAKSGLKPIVAGKSAESELYKRVIATADEDRMPPDKTLTKAQTDLLKRWIDEGAEYQGHWAFQTIKQPPVPAVKDPNWAHNDIDKFILSRLEKEGLKPSPEADKITLLRRASLDLTSLPPTPAEVDAFLADNSPNAYEKQIDRLLASPRYGETMALRWLDGARYADSHGFQSDNERYQWPWRDWVINSFNSNKPFDQFTIEQIGGDLLPNATNEQILATGFNRNHRITDEGGSIPEEWRTEYVIDRVETTGTVWLGLTLNCCRCHDHKYDPVTQKEFYQLFAFFNNVPDKGLGKGAKNEEPVLKIMRPEQQAKTQELTTKLDAAKKSLMDSEAGLPSLQEKWEVSFREELKSLQAAWKPLGIKDVKSEGGAKFKQLPDGSWLASGANPARDTYVASMPLSAGNFSGLLIEVLPDASLPNQSLGRYDNGNFVLTGVEAEITAPGLAKPIEVDFARAETDYEQPGYEVKYIVEEAPKVDKTKKVKGAKPKPVDKKGWAVDGNDVTKRLPRKAMFLAAAPATVPAGATLTVTLKHEGIDGHNIGRFKLAATSLPPAAVKLSGGSIPDSLRAALNAEPAKRTPAQRNELSKFFRENTDNPYKQAELALASAKKALDTFQESMPTAMVMSEEPKPRDAFVLIRGQYDKKGEKVTAALPAALPPMPAGQPMNRLGLAKWIVDPSNPLTARIAVNRFWEKFFGTGIVKSSENFGSQAEWPSHPELLDWLAFEFMSKGWDMKAFQKMIVMSATYRQASKVSPELVEKDPENRLLARGPRFRLQAEILRDQALYVAGLLVEKVGGPSVRPYQPVGIWDETNVYGNLRNYKHDQGEGLYRRSMYTIWKRTCAPPQMLLFDAPGREICTVKRSRTNTPLQALTMLNEITYVEASRVLAQRMIQEGGTSVSDRIAFAYRRAVGRKPSEREAALLSAGLEKRLAKYKADPEAAKKFISNGDTKPDPKIDPVELAAYSMTANVIMNLDEMVTKE